MKMMIGENIKRLRKEKNITQEQLAEVLNISCTAVSKWERAETLPDITLLQPLAFYFGVSVDVLLGYDEQQIRLQIDERLAEYYRLYRLDIPSARKMIAEIYREYPNDYRVMNAYMWDIVGDMADNNRAAILSHDEELNAICDRILSGCNDESLRTQAWNMKGKILHAKGNTDEALSVYREHMNNWYQTAEQKSEQLFDKDTPEFLHWVKYNAYELAAFCADKFHKSIFFDRSIPYKTRVERIERFCDAVSALRQETGEFFWASMENSVRGRLFNDLIFREGEDEDILRIGEKLFASGDIIEAMAAKQKIYDEDRISRFNGKRFIASAIKSKHSRWRKLLEKREFAELFRKYS